MDKETALKAIDQFRLGLLSRGIRPDGIVLYGSYARGENREGSDIDLVVISKDFEGKDYWARIDVLSDAIYETSAPIEAVAMTPEEWQSGNSLIATFAKNGEMLYAA